MDIQVEQLEKAIIELEAKLYRARILGEFTKASLLQVALEELNEEVKHVSA